MGKSRTFFPSFASDIAGVNDDPFTVADALVENNADHEVSGDYTYDVATATAITLDGTSVTVDGGTVNGATYLETVTISSTVTSVTP
nr:hypothetical protein [Candidatus Krumholzibacteria bacterium]